MSMGSGRVRVSSLLFSWFRRRRSRGCRPQHGGGATATTRPTREILLLLCIDVCVLSSFS